MSGKFESFVSLSYRHEFREGGGREGTSRHGRRKAEHLLGGGCRLLVSVVRIQTVVVVVVVVESVTLDYYVVRKFCEFENFTSLGNY